MRLRVVVPARRLSIMCVAGKKSVISFAAILVVLLLAILKVPKLIGEDDTRVSERSGESLREAAKFETTGSNQQVTSPVKKSSISVPDNAQKRGIDAADWYSFKLWKRDNGYPDPEDEVIYSEYDVPVLSSMAENGDVFAIQELGRRAYNLELGVPVDTSVDFALNAYRDAAVRGSTYALTLIGDHQLANVGMEKNNKKRIDMVVTGLAWYKAAVMRGDVMVEQTHAETFRKINNVSLSQNQEARIVSKARELLGGLQKDRQELGLGEYENSTHDVADVLSQKTISSR